MELYNLEYKLALVISSYSKQYFIIGWKCYLIKNIVIKNKNEIIIISLFKQTNIITKTLSMSPSITQCKSNITIVSILFKSLVNLLKNNPTLINYLI